MNTDEIIENLKNSSYYDDSKYLDRFMAGIQNEQSQKIYDNSVDQDDQNSIDGFIWKILRLSMAQYAANVLHDVNLQKENDQILSEGII